MSCTALGTRQHYHNVDTAVWVFRLSVLTRKTCRSSATTVSERSVFIDYISLCVHPCNVPTAAVMCSVVLGGKWIPVHYSEGTLYRMYTILTLNPNTNFKPNYKPLILTLTITLIANLFGIANLRNDGPSEYWVDTGKCRSLTWSEAKVTSRVSLLTSNTASWRTCKLDRTQQGCHWTELLGRYRIINICIIAWIFRSS